MTPTKTKSCEFLQDALRYFDRLRVSNYGDVCPIAKILASRDRVIVSTNSTAADGSPWQQLNSRYFVKKPSMTDGPAKIIDRISWSRSRCGRRLVRKMEQAAIARAGGVKELKHWALEVLKGEMFYEYPVVEGKRDRYVVSMDCTFAIVPFQYLQVFRLIHPPSETR